MPWPAIGVRHRFGRHFSKEIAVKREMDPSPMVDGVIEWSDIKPSARERLLRSALHKEMNRSKPLHQRDKEEDEEEEEYEDSGIGEHDEENDALVNLHNEKGKPKSIPVTEEDLSDDAIETLRKKSKVADPEVEKDRRPKIKSGKYRKKTPPKAE